MFARETHAGVLVREETGWIFESPDINLMIQLEKDAKRVTVIHKGNLQSVGGITKVVVDRGPAGNYLNFVGRVSWLSLLFTRSGLEVSGEVNSRNKSGSSFRWKA